LHYSKTFVFSPRLKLTLKREDLTSNLIENQKKKKKKKKKKVRTKEANVGLEENKIK
jgi:hypothetical protein